MPSTLPVRGSGTGTRSKGKGKAKKETLLEVNVLEESSSVAGKKRGSQMIDVKNEDEESVQDYSKLTVAVLREMIDSRGIEKEGAKLKADLITLLEAYDLDPTTRNNSNGGEDKKPSKSKAASSAIASGPKAKKQKKAPSNVGEDKKPSKSKAASSVPKVKKKKKTPKPKPPPYVQPADFDPVDHNSVATGEKRLREYQPFPTEDVHKKMWKATTERMFMLDRKKGLDGDRTPQETFQIAGSTGNIYTVVFGKNPTCTCIDAKVGNKQRCKHMIYAKMIILKIEGNLVYQIAYLSSELQEIFANAPVTQLPLISHDQIEDESIYNGSHKPVEGDCPICVMPFEDDEEIVWCKAACGQNFHTICMEKWKEHSHGQVKCVYCRTPWQEDNQPQPSAFSQLVESAPKVKGFKNISHLPMYQSQDAGSAYN